MNITDIQDIPTVSAKLANMRKPQEFIVSRVEGNSIDTIYIQSDKSTGAFYPETGKGKFTTKGPYYVDLCAALPYTFPKSFVEECMKVLA
jgi:hypothetical protein